MDITTGINLNVTEHEQFSLKSNQAVLCNKITMTVHMFSGVQHVPGDSFGLHHSTQGGSAGLAFCPAHSAAEEDGGRPAGFSPGQSPEGPGYHKV